MRRRKESLIMIVIISVLFLGIGYAYITTNLSINGTADVDSNTWNVYWDNVQVTEGSVTGDQVITQPTIDTNKTTVSFHIRLKEPGEYYEFTVDAKNDGSIDAMIDTITKTVNNNTTIPNYLDYTVTFSDGVPIGEDYLLSSGSKEIYRVRIEYKLADIEITDLPSTAQSLNLNFSVNYAQSKESEALTRLYYMGGSSIEVGLPLPNGVVTYNDYMDILGRNTGLSFLIIIMKNGIVSDGYAALYLNGRMLNLKQGGATYNESTSSYNEDSIYYDENVKALKKVFGEDRCEERTNNNSTICYRCTYRSSSYACKNGEIAAGANAQGYAYACGIIENGRFLCGG